MRIGVLSVHCGSVSHCMRMCDERQDTNSKQILEMEECSLQQQFQANPSFDQHLLLIAQKGEIVFQCHKLLTNEKV